MLLHKIQLIHNCPFNPLEPAAIGDLYRLDMAATGFIPELAIIALLQKKFNNCGLEVCVPFNVNVYVSVHVFIEL